MCQVMLRQPSLLNDFKRRIKSPSGETLARIPPPTSRDVSDEPLTAIVNVEITKWTFS